MHVTDFTNTFPTNQDDVLLQTAWDRPDKNYIYETKMKLSVESIQSVDESVKLKRIEKM